MFCRRSEFTFLQLVLIAEVGIMVTLMSSYAIQNCRTEEAGRTLTRQAILSFRLTACKLDQRTCLHIRSLGCAARRRGSRGGQLKVKSKVTPCSSMSFVTGNRRTHSHTVSSSSNNEQRPSCTHNTDIKLMAIPVVTGLRPRSSVSRSTRYNVRPSARIVIPTYELYFPCFFIANLRGGLVQKMDELGAAMNENNVDIACITETWLKP